QTIQIPYRRLAASPVAISVQSERITANLDELWFFPSSGCDTFLENYTTPICVNSTAAQKLSPY
ncbi:MAG: hypothetical protein IJ899_01650, partial [Blautia sp.]|nr:hypothetical protein [Blautia sp.]